MNAEQLFFQNGRSMSVKSVRVDGNIITVTLPNGGEASFDKAAVAEIKPDEMPLVKEIAPAVVAPAMPQVAAAVSNLGGPLQPRQAVHAPLDGRPFADLIETVALKHGVDPELVHAVVQAESNYQVRAKSRVGARGLMQVMPETARDFGIKNLYDPENNLEAGVQYLKWLFERFDGNLKKTIAAYNAGPTAVRRAGGVPDFKETQQYVKKVMKNFYD